MSFTERFIKVPVEIVRNADENLCTPEETLCVEMMRVIPFEIIAYRKHYDDDGNYNDKVTIELKNRENMIVCLKMEEFENLLNKFS